MPVPDAITLLVSTKGRNTTPSDLTAWDAIAVYALNDSRWKDDPNVLKNIAGVDKIIGDKDFEAWFPFGYSLYASSRDNPVSFEIKMIR